MGQIIQHKEAPLFFEVPVLLWYQYQLGNDAIARRVFWVSALQHSVCYSCTWGVCLSWQTRSTILTVSTGSYFLCPESFCWAQPSCSLFQQAIGRWSQLLGEFLGADHSPKRGRSPRCHSTNDSQKTPQCHCICLLRAGRLKYVLRNRAVTVVQEPS